MKHVIALFGEAEKGTFKKAHFLKEIPQLMDRLGNPPPDSEGLFFAIQALLFQRDLIYFRVEEEGFSEADYYFGLKLLETEEKIKVHALCMPGVGEAKIVNAFQPLFDKHHSLLITSQKDLYDYLSSPSA
jgi:hypothetical protein